MAEPSNRQALPLSARRKPAHGDPLPPPGSWRRGRVFQVLTYHRVSPHADGVFNPTPPSVFEMQVRHLARYYNVLTAGQAARRAKAGTLPRRAVCITFDDGYEDNYLHAFPILRKYGLTATVFVSTGPMETGTPLWHDRVFGAFALTRQTTAQVDGDTLRLTTRMERWDGAKRFVAQVRRLSEGERIAAVDALGAELGVSPKRAWDRTPMLSWAQVREMAEAGIEIGAHTVTHPILSLLPPDRQDQEIRNSVDTVDKQVGARPGAFAYPNGRAEDFDETTVGILKALRIPAAYTTNFGTNGPGSDPYRLKRGGPTARTPLGYGLKMLWYRWTAQR